MKFAALALILLALIYLSRRQPVNESDHIWNSEGEPEYLELGI